MNTKAESSVELTNLCKTELEILQSDGCKRMIKSYFDKNKNLNKEYFLNIFNQILISGINNKGLEVPLEDIKKFIELINSDSFIDYSNNYLGTAQNFFGKKEELINFFETFNIKNLKQYLIKTLMDSYRLKIINSLNGGKELNDNEAEVIIEFNGKKLYKTSLVNSYFLVEDNKVLLEFDGVWPIEDGVNGDKVFEAEKGDKKMYIGLTTGLPIGGEFDHVGNIERGVNGDKLFKAKRGNKQMYISLTTGLPIGGEFDTIGYIREGVNGNKIFAAWKGDKKMHISLTTVQKIPGLFGQMKNFFEGLKFLGRK